MTRFYANPNWEDRMRDPDKYPEVLQPGYHDYFEVKGEVVNHCKVPIDMPPLEATVTYRSDARKTLNFLKSYQISKNVSLLDFQDMMSDPGKIVNVRTEELPTKVLTAQLETVALESLASDVVMVNPTKGTIVRAKMAGVNNAYCVTDPENPAVKEAEDLICREGYPGAKVGIECVSKAYYGYNLSNSPDDGVPEKCGFIYDKKKTKYVGGGLLAEGPEDMFSVSHRGFQKLVKQYKGDGAQFPLFEYNRNVYLSRALNWVSTTAQCPFGRTQKYTRNTTEMVGVIMYPNFYYLRGNYTKSHKDDMIFYYDEEGDLIDYSSKRTYSHRMKHLLAHVDGFRNKWLPYPAVTPQKPFLLASDAMRNVIVFSSDGSELIGKMVQLTHPLARILGVTPDSEIWEVMKSVPSNNLGFLREGFAMEVTDPKVMLLALRRRYGQYFRQLVNSGQRHWFALGDGNCSYRRKHKVKIKMENTFVDPVTMDQYVQDEFDNHHADRALDVLTLKKNIENASLDVGFYQDWKY